MLGLYNKGGKGNDSEVVIEESKDENNSKSNIGS
jgi:hypothetical protein